MRIRGTKHGFSAGVLSAALVLSAAAQEAIAVPSGQHITLQEVVWGEPGPYGLTVRFRFVAPQISPVGGDIDFETAANDMQYLCDTYALTRIADPGPRVEQIIISLADRPVDFGETMPEATQFFEAYRPEGNQCIWEAF